MDNTTVNTVSTPPGPPLNTAPPPPAVSHQAHANLNLILSILLHLAPAIAAPFIKSTGAVTIFNTETPIAIGLADALGQVLNQPQ